MSLGKSLSHYLPSPQFIKQFSGVAGFQAAQMVISAVIGFVIVRHLEKEQYAQLNLLNTGIAVIAGWSSLALSSIFVPFANQTDPQQSSVRDTSQIFRSLNRPLLWVAILACLIFWGTTSIRNHWLNWPFFLAMLLALGVSLCLYVYRFPENAYKISQRPLLPFRISVVSELIRLVLIVPVIYVLYPCYPALGSTWVMLLALVTAAWALFNIHKKFNAEPHGVFPKKDHHSNTFWKLFKPLIFPQYFYHIAQMFRGSLIYLVSSGSVIAETAALGRLMMTFAMLDKAVELVVIPRLATIKEHKKFVKVLAIGAMGMLGVSASLALSSWVLPGPWLWLLGEKYENLNSALVWAVAAAGIERVSGLILFGQLARGETSNQWWVPIFSTSSYVCYAAYFGLDTADKATLALLVGALTNLIAQLVILTWRLTSPALKPL